MRQWFVGITIMGLQTSQKTQLIYLAPTQIAVAVTLFRERADKE